MNVFIPLTDEMLETGVLPDELVAYRPGQPLLSQYHHTPSPAQSSVTVIRSPGPTPSSEALPALSSSTYLAGAKLG